MGRGTIAIIGGGMAGLTAAAYLSEAGFKVRVFEQHTSPGGYVSSFERHGFTFPAGPTSFGSNGIVFPILKELGLIDRLSFVKARHQVSWDEHDVPLLSPRQACRELADIFPTEKGSLRRYFRLVEAGAGAFEDMLNGGMMFGRKVFKAMLKLVLRRPSSFWAMRAASRHTNRSLHDIYFKDPLLKQLLNRLGYPVMSGRNTLGMWASYFCDAWAPGGGMQKLADLLTEYIREHGGEVLLGERVRQIVIENEGARGVELQNGATFSADWVISAADLNETFLQLIDSGHLPAATAQKLERARPSESIFAVYLGLNNSPELAAALKRFKQSHVFFTCADGKYIQLVLLSKDDPSVAPDGKHALYVATLSPYDEWEGLKVDRKAYLARKAVVARELLSRAEQFLPGLSAHIIMQEAASPLTSERYTSNWRGSTAGWNWDPKYAPHFDFEKDLPVKHFYPVGHYVHNPGGVPTAMITSWYIAKSIIQEADNCNRHPVSD